MISASPSPSPRSKKERPSSNGKDQSHQSPKVPPELGWLDDACIQDVDHLAKTVAGIKGKGLRPDLLSSILSHCVSRWLPELSGRTPSNPSPESPTAAWLKKRFFIETLVAVLPPDKGAVPCDILLRLLRAASMVGAEAACLQDLEARAAAQLDEASLTELMIPAFSHISGTLLNVGLVLRLVRRFVGSEGEAAVATSRSGAALSKVAKLADSYLAEAALDAGLSVNHFEELARALPAHSRALDDALYRAIDTYIKVHPNVSKQDKRTLCRLIDARKLTAEASSHAVQNERLPVRLVIQVLFTENNKLNRITDKWSGSFTGPRSPKNPEVLEPPPGRCPSKREVLAHQQEMRRLRDDVGMLQALCHSLQAQLVKMASESKKRRGFFRWSNFLFRSSDMSVGRVDDYDFGLEHPTPTNILRKGRTAPQKATPTNLRHSMS